MMNTIAMVGGDVQVFVLYFFQFQWLSSPLLLGDPHVPPGVMVLVQRSVPKTITHISSIRNKLIRLACFRVWELYQRIICGHVSTHSFNDIF